jgi:hypothetical protein
MAATNPEILRLRRRVKVLESGLDERVEAVAEAVWTVPSQSQPDDFHVVSRLSNGVLVCDCEGNRHGVECSHVIAVQLVLEREVWERQERARKERPLPASKAHPRKEVALL